MKTITEFAAPHLKQALKIRDDLFLVKQVESRKKTLEGTAAEAAPATPSPESASTEPSESQTAANPTDTTTTDTTDTVDTVTASADEEAPSQEAASQTTESTETIQTTQTTEITETAETAETVETTEPVEIVETSPSTETEASASTSETSDTVASEESVSETPQVSETTQASSETPQRVVIRESKKGVIIPRSQMTPEQLAARPHKSREDVAAERKALEEAVFKDLGPALQTQLKWEGEKLNHVLSALRSIDRKRIQDLKRVVVFKLDANEKKPNEAFQDGEVFYLAEYLPPLRGKPKGKRFPKGKWNPRDKKRGKRQNKRFAGRGDKREGSSGRGPRSGAAVGKDSGKITPVARGASNT